MTIKIFIPLVFMFSGFFCSEKVSSQISNGSKTIETEWILSDIIRSADSGIRATGNPRTIKCKYGKALLFNGKNDGLFLDKMPLAGLEQFTIEVIFRPDRRGKVEQRFFHCGEVRGDRVLMETRTTSTDWYLDAFIITGDQQEALIKPELLHPLGQWYHVAFVVDRGKLATYVNGSKELEGHIDMAPLKSGKTSIGVRQNEESWFKGAINKIRISPEALNPVNFMKY